jgi:hypothetical protein
VKGFREGIRRDAHWLPKFFPQNLSGVGEFEFLGCHDWYSASVMVRDLDIQRVTIERGEADPPLLIDANAVVAFAVAVEKLKLIRDGDRSGCQRGAE